jgi:hypothetical protein
VVLKSSIIIKYFLPSHSLLLLFVPNKQIPLGGVSHPCSRVAPASAECCACPSLANGAASPTVCPIIPLRPHRPTTAPLTRAAPFVGSSDLQPGTHPVLNFNSSKYENLAPGIWVTCFLKLPREAASSSGLLSLVSGF